MRRASGTRFGAGERRTLMALEALGVGEAAMKLKGGEQRARKGDVDSRESDLVIAPSSARESEIKENTDLRISSGEQKISSPDPRLGSRMLR
jgi:hypothetical protein